MAIQETLATVEIFSELPRKDLARLAKAVAVRKFDKGDVIAREGDLGVAFYVLTKGHVEVVKNAGQPDERVLAKIAPDAKDSFFGEMALFDNHVRSATVRAAEDGVECFVLTRWDFNAELMAPGGRIAMAMLAVLARRIRQMDEAAVRH